MIAKNAFMGDVGVTKDQIVGADASGSGFGGAAVDGDVFPENIVIADMQPGGFADVFEILGFPADRGEGKKFVVFANRAMTFDDDVGMQHAVIAECDIGTDHAVRADADIIADLGEWGNNGGGVNHGRTFRWSGRCDEMFFRVKRGAS